MKAHRLLLCILLVSHFNLSAFAGTLGEQVQRDYDAHLGQLFDHFHRNPELSMMETETAARLAAELRDAGFEVTEGIGDTGVVAVLENGPGPRVMMRADMDGLPVREQSGLSYASTRKQLDWDGNEVYTMHACGHGASPHTTVDPIVLGSQIVLALQTVVSRTLPPREAGVITVGSFHAGSKHNIIPDSAHLQLTVRNDNVETRKILLDGIRRVAENMGRVAGLPEDMLPVVTVSQEWVPPIVNDSALTKRLRSVWIEALGEDIFWEEKRVHMGAEDFPFFTFEPYIPSTYFGVGGTPMADIEANRAGTRRLPSHHSPLFKIDPGPSVTLGVEATVLALRELLQDQPARLDLSRQ